LREYRHMTVTIDIPKEIEASLLSEAEASGVPLRQLVRDVLIDHFEETEDRHVAESRLEDRQTPISAHQLRKNLGLDN
jgi:predicted DNA-binding protein